MDKNKKEQTFKDLFANIKDDNKANFNYINQISKEETKSNTQESFNNLLKETKKNEANEELVFNNILKETPSLANKEESNKKEEPEEEKIIFKEDIIDNLENNNKKEEIIDNPFFDNKEESNKEEEIIDNPFFANKEESNKKEEEPEEEKVIFNEEEYNDIEKKETKEEKDNKIEDVLDKNPFFIDEEDDSNNNEVLAEIDNKINLVENQKHEIAKEDNSKIDTSNTKHFNVKIVRKKEPLIKSIIGVLSYAVFIWLLFVGLALLIYVADIKIRAAKGDTSSPKYNAYVVLTGSMLPEIQVYDVVVTKKTNAKDLKEGDVITFASSDTRFLNTIITHRIIKKYYDAEKKQYTFQTKGDNNNVADSALVQANNIYGKVILKIPKLGYLQDFLASRGGWIIVILLPCLAVISYDIVKLVKRLKRKKYKNIKVEK